MIQKTVLITGCSTGLGNTAAKKFAKEGWNVIATMRRPDDSLEKEFPEQKFLKIIKIVIRVSYKILFQRLQNIGHIFPKDLRSV